MTTTTTITQSDVLAALGRYRGGATTEELAKALGSTERVMRRHLSVLHAKKKVLRTFFYSGNPPVGRYRYIRPRTLAGEGRQRS